MNNKALSVVTLIALSGVGTAVAGTTVGNTTFNVSGFLKADAMFTKYNDGSPAASNIDDFYIPALVPTAAPGAGGNGPDVTFNSHAKQSRFRITSGTKLANGMNVATLLEMDFGPGWATANGKKTTNRSGVDLRHAVVSYGNWKFGQTWSNGLNGSSIAETLDFFALAEGMVDTRQMQIRYTSGAFSISLENPVSVIDGMETKNSSVPDVIAKYSFKGDWGNVSVAGIARQLKFQDAALNVDSSKTAVGVFIAGRIKAGVNDDIRFALNSGRGLGRYIGLALNSDGYIDANNEIETIDQTSGFIAYRHFWSKKTRSTFGYAFYDGDADADAVTYNEKSSSIHVNLLHSPIKKLTVGVEYIYGKLEKSNGNVGDMSRVQFSGKYSF